MADEPYFIQVATNGCSQCGHGRMWAVIGPDGAQQSTVFEEEEDATALADALNDAYHRGVDAEMQAGIARE